MPSLEEFLKNPHSVEPLEKVDTSRLSNDGLVMKCVQTYVVQGTDSHRKGQYVTIFEGTWFTTADCKLEVTFPKGERSNWKPGHKLVLKRDLSVIA